MDFRLDQAQFVVFLSAIDTSGKLKIASSAVKAIAELDGVDPLMLPFPDNAPGEVPRIQIQNDAAGWGFSYSPVRIDLFHTPRQELNPDRVVEALGELHGRVADLWGLLAAEVSAKGRRLAQIVNVSAAIERPADAIHAKYLAPIIAGPLAEAQVHYLRKLEVAGIQSNRWVRLLSQEAMPGRLLVQVDLNTVGDQVLDVSPAMIMDFGASASEEVANILRGTTGEVA